MRTSAWDLGDGTVYELDSPSEVKRLPSRLRKLVPPRMTGLLGGFPGSIRSLGESVKSPAFRAWLAAAAAKSRATIAVYAVRRTMPQKAFLKLDFGSRSVLIDCLTGKPRHCPAPLAEVYATIGGLVTQYGASGSLLSPREVRPLVKLEPWCVAHLFGPETGITRRDARGWYAYFERDGDYLCYRKDGRSRWFGFEWAGSRRMISTRRCVESSFGALRAGEYFRAQ